MNKNRNEIIWKDIKSDFPILNNVTYLDSASTSQKPTVVINKINELYTKYNANIHRGVYIFSEKTTAEYESSKEKVKKFLNISDASGYIAYTLNATYALNQIARMMEETYLNEGDEIICSIYEHHSNFLPWIEVAKRKHLNLKILYEVNIENIKKTLNRKTKVLALTHFSNVTGDIFDIGEILDYVNNTEYLNNGKCITVIDGTQAVGKIKIDIDKLNPSFYVFSAHKVFSPTGLGVYYVNKNIENKIKPVNYGGDMVNHVETNSCILKEMPYMLEAGTQNYESAIGLKSAIEYIENIGIENVEERLKVLSDYLRKKVMNLDYINAINIEKFFDVLSFSIKGIHSHDIASFLSERNVFIRAGYHCAEPLVSYINHDESLARVSLHIYNDFEDIDKFIDSIQDCYKYLKIK